MGPGHPGGGGGGPFARCRPRGVSQPLALSGAAATLPCSRAPPLPPARQPLPFSPLCPQALHSLGLGLLARLHSLTPWRYALKRIGGQFGSSVLSYFLFLKTLLAFNGLLLLPELAFVVGVQAAFPPPAPPGPGPAFSGLELLTGGVRAWPGRLGGRAGSRSPPGRPGSPLSTSGLSSRPAPAPAPAAALRPPPSSAS